MTPRLALALPLSLALSTLTAHAHAHGPRPSAQPATGPVDNPAQQLLDEHDDVFVARIDAVERDGDGPRALSVRTLRRLEGDAADTERLTAAGDEGRCRLWPQRRDAHGHDTAPPGWRGANFMRKGGHVVVFRREGACSFAYDHDDPGDLDAWSAAWDRRHGHVEALHTRLRERACKGAPDASTTPSTDTALIAYGTLTGHRASGAATLTVETAFLPGADRGRIMEALPGGRRLTLSITDADLTDLQGTRVVARARRTPRGDGYAASFCHDLRPGTRRPVAPAGFVTLPAHKLSCDALDPTYDATAGDHVVLVVAIDPGASRASFLSPTTGLRVQVRDVLHGPLPDGTKEATVFRVDSRGGAAPEPSFDPSGLALVVGKLAAQDPEGGPPVIEVERCGPSRSITEPEVPTSLDAFLAQEHVRLRSTTPSSSPPPLASPAPKATSCATAPTPTPTPPSLILLGALAVPALRRRAGARGGPQKGSKHP